MLVRGGKALAAVGAVAAALSAAGSAQPREKTPAGPLGLVTDGTTSSLVRLNAKNLRPLQGERLDLAAFAGSWAYSPDRTLLALGVDSGVTSKCADRHAALRLVDVATLSAQGDIPLGIGYMAAAAWLAPERLVAVVSRCASAPELLVVDPGSRRVLETHSLPADLSLGWVRSAGGRLVLYAGGSLTVVDSDGTMRSVSLDRIGEGLPGLAITQDGRRAFVASGNGLIADVDTSSLSITYHGPLGMSAPTGDVASTRRFARVLPTGELAVAGSQDVRYVDLGGDRIRHIGTGMALINTDAWTAQIVDFSSARFVVAANTILATGSSWGGGSYYVSTSEPSPPQPLGDGVTAYTSSGARLYHRFSTDAFVEQVYGSRAFVYVNGISAAGQLDVLNVRTGKLIGRRLESTLPWILQGSSSLGT